MPSSSKDKKRKSSSPTHTTSSPSTAVLSEVISQADKLKKKKVAPTAHAPPASIGDALKDEMRKNQQRKSKDAAAVASSTSWQTDESAPFPRGGGSALTPLEHKAVVTAAREEALFEEPEPAAEGGGKAADAINDHGASSAGAIAAGGGAELVRAHALRRKAMAGGTRSLCAVCEVASDQLMVQLPSRVLGKIGREEVSDELYDLASQEDGSPLPDLRKIFRVGEILCCAPLPAAKAGSVSTARDKSNRRRSAQAVDLTLRLSLVQRASLAASPRLRAGHLLWATVRSGEEYGWVMDTGAPSGGFLHRSKWHGAGEPARWRPHLMAMASSLLQQPRKPLQLAAVSEAYVPRPTTQETAYKFEGLSAGMLVEAQVSGVLGDGLRMVFLGYFEATVGCDALGGTGADWAKRFAKGTKLTARVLFVDPASKAVGLGVAPHLTACAAYAPPLPLGAPLATEVTQIVGSHGALLTATSKPQKEEEEEEKAAATAATAVVGGWLGRANIADLAPRQTADEALKALRVGARAAGVVVGVHHLEGLLEISTRPSAVREASLGHAEVQVGDVVKGTVARIDSGRGLRVRLSKGLYGTCSLAQLADAQLQRPLDKFSKGQAVTGIVLESEPERKKLLLSLKPTLVGSGLPRISSYAAAVAGVTTHGVVARVSPKSILLELLGGVRGIVRGSELRAKFGALWEEDPASCYREGQVVECTVIECTPKQQRLTLTLLSEAERASKPAAKLLQKEGRRAPRKARTPPGSRHRRNGARAVTTTTRRRRGARPTAPSGACARPRRRSPAWLASSTRWQWATTGRSCAGSTRKAPSSGEST